MSKLYLPSAQGGLENLPPEYVNENLRSENNQIHVKKGDFLANKVLKEGSNTYLREEAEKFDKVRKSDY